MATYYWVGGNSAGTFMGWDSLTSTASLTGANNLTWLRAFDWNNPFNWRTRTGSIPANYSYNFPLDVPGPGDIAIFGNDEFAGANQAYALPSARAPCLWGGAFGNASGATWNAGQSGGGAQFGGTFASSLANVIIKSNGGRTGTQYPFRQIGGGLANAAFGGSPNSPLHNAQLRSGITFSSTISWEDLVTTALASTGGNSRYSSLSLKTPAFNVDRGFGETYGTGLPQAPHFGKIDVKFIKNLTAVGASGSTGYVLTTVVQNNSPAELKVSGYASNISAVFPTSHMANHTAQAIDPAFWTFAPVPYLALSGLTAGVVSVIPENASGNQRQVGPQSSTVAADCLLSEMTVLPVADNKYFVQLQGKFNKALYLQDTTNIGTIPGDTGEFEPNFYIGSPLAQGLTPSVENYLTGVVFGSDGATFSAPGVWLGDSNFGDVAGLGLKVKGYFGGTSLINRMNADRAYISGWGDEINSTSSVKVGELYMKNDSVLDFAAAAQFDKWEFGKQVGSDIQGGIIFEDETATIKGSAGLRLWNDQLVFGTNRLGDGSLRGSPKVSAQVTLSDTQ
jgi:hypothetical protein